MVWRPFCFKIAISSKGNAHFCFKGFVLCQWCQIDDSKNSKFRWLDLLGWVCLVDIGCHGGWPTTAHQSTTDDQQQPTNNPPKSGHRSDNQHSPTNQPIDNTQPITTNQRATANNQSTNLPPTSQPSTSMIPGAVNPSPENRSSEGLAGCAEHLNNSSVSATSACGRLFSTIVHYRRPNASLRLPRLAKILTVRT